MHRFIPLGTSRTFGALALAAIAFVLASCASEETPSGPNTQAPTITEVLPGYALAGADSVKLTVKGTGFVDGSILEWNGAALATTFISETRLLSVASGSLIASPDTASIRVVNPGEGGASESVSFAVVTGNPFPQVYWVDPLYALTGQAFEATVHGSGFMEQSVIVWNGRERETTFVSATTLTVSIASSVVETPGSHTVAVENPEPGGGRSDSYLFYVFDPNPVPFILSITPDEFVAGSRPSAVLLVLDGGGFMETSQAYFNGVARTTYFEDETQILVQLLFDDQYAAGTASILVQNPEPGGGFSEEATITIPNAVPVLTSISPSRASAVNGPVTIAVAGTGFSKTSSVRWDGLALPTRFLDSRRLEADVSADLLDEMGIASVDVRNPAPGGGTSASAAFTAYLEMPFAVNDAAYDASRDVVYLAVPSSGGSIGNSVVVMDYHTGEVLDSEYAGSEPMKLAMSWDAAYLYVGFDGTGTVRRFDLDTLSPDLTFSLGADDFRGTHFVEDMVVLPEDPETVVISRRSKNLTPRHAGVVAFKNGLEIPGATPDHTGSNVLEPSGEAGRIYGFNNETSEFGFRTMTVDTGGVHIESVLEGTITGYGTDIVFESGLIYSSLGHVLEPESGTLLGNVTGSGAVCPVTSLNKIYFLEGTSTLTLKMFNMSTLTPTDDVILGNFGARAKQLFHPSGDWIVFRTDQGKVIIFRHDGIGETVQ